MIDYARITVKAGDGGGGTGSFRHNKGKRRGKADGGDGGDGGNVYLEATNDMNTLEPYRFVKDYAAKNGERGLSNLKNGARGADLVLKVPVGTEVRVESQEIELESERVRESKSEREIYDLVHAGQRILVARGGEHGRGNAHLRDEFGRRPLSGEKGVAGESISLTLELKLIAQVGLIGLPNAGKSTLLAVLTKARPQIADYPFTTLEPNLGVMKPLGPVKSFPPASAHLDDMSGSGVKSVSLRAVGSPSTFATQKSGVVIADIPGLIEGASLGKGLGDLFLRHVERTKILVHLADVTKGAEVESLLTDYRTIRHELKAYSKELAKKKEIIVLTKADLASPEQIDEAKRMFKSIRRRVFVVSARTGEGLAWLVKEIVKKVN